MQLGIDVGLTSCVPLRFNPLCQIDPPDPRDVQSTVPRPSERFASILLCALNPSAATAFLPRRDCGAPSHCPLQNLFFVSLSLCLQRAAEGTQTLVWEERRCSRWLHPAQRNRSEIIIERLDEREASALHSFPERESIWQSRCQLKGTQGRQPRRLYPSNRYL